MPPKLSRTERGKQAILDMVSKVFPEVVGPDVALYEGTNRNVTFGYILAMPVEQAIEALEFMTKVYDYFEPYRCVVGSGARQTVISYVRCKSCYMRDGGESPSIIGNVVADFEIKYFKDHIPYPAPDSLSQLTAHLSLAEANILLQKKENNRLVKKNNMLISKSKQYMKNMRRIISTMYESCPNKQDCPTCWEQISTDKLVVPVCGHFICSDCKDKLAKPECPMCREPIQNWHP